MFRVLDMLTKQSLDVTCSLRKLYFRPFLAHSSCSLNGSIYTLNYVILLMGWSNKVHGTDEYKAPCLCGLKYGQARRTTCTKDRTLK